MKDLVKFDPVYYRLMIFWLRLHIFQTIVLMTTATLLVANHSETQMTAHNSSKYGLFAVLLNAFRFNRSISAEV